MESPAMKQAKKYASELKFDNPRLSSDEMYGRREDAKEDFYAGAVWGLGIEMPAHLKTHGTITWYNCDEMLPPIYVPRELDQISRYVLVTNGFELAKSFYHYSKQNKQIGWQMNNFSWIPTHWAYINFPEQ